jgi:hypothetical protein
MLPSSDGGGEEPMEDLKVFSLSFETLLAFA